MFKWCSVMDLGMPVISASFQPNISKLSLSSSLGGRAFCVSTTILHSAGTMVLLQIVTIPPSTGNFSIPALVECSPSLRVTVSDICPNDQDISPLNPMRGVVAGINLFLFLFSAGPLIGGSALNFTVSIARISFGVFVRDVKRSCHLLDLSATSPFRKAVVTLIISSTDFGMLSFSFLIRWEFVEPDSGGADEYGVEHVTPGGHWPSLYLCRCLEDL
ncbi:hypothetical protein Tco_0502685 [Tanacetum coccineum]